LTAENGCSPRIVARPDDNDNDPPPKHVNGFFTVVSNFAQTILKQLPDVVDGNPVKIALGLAKMGVEWKDVGSACIVFENCTHNSHRA